MRRKFKKLLLMFLVVLLAFPTGLISVTAETGSSESDNLIIHHDFETEDTHGWEPLSWAPSAEVETTYETASTGNQSLKFFNRSERGSSLALNLTNKLDKGETYTLSFDVKMSEGTDTLRLAS
ncbi:carbohydrate binding domain-containing protein, partial [Bacillus tamaricis]